MTLEEAVKSCVRRVQRDIPDWNPTTVAGVAVLVGQCLAREAISWEAMDTFRRILRKQGPLQQAIENVLRERSWS